MKDDNRLGTPSPEPTKKRARYTSVRQFIPPPPPPSTRIHSQSHHRHHPHKSSRNSSNSSRSQPLLLMRDLSLSTIAEESGSYQSASAVNMERSVSQVGTMDFKQIEIEIKKKITPHLL